MIEKYYPVKIMKELYQYEMTSNLLYDKKSKCPESAFEYMVKNKVPERTDWYKEKHN